MYPQNTQPGTVGKVIIKEAPASQAQMAAMAQMQEQMRQMQAQLEAQRQPKVKTYSFGQVQILLCCETINHVLEEFELGTQKRQRLNMSRDYLLALSELDEFIATPPTIQDQAHGQELEQAEGEPLEESLFEEDNAPATAPKEANIGVEKYPGKVDKTVEEEIEKINKKMAELKKNEAVEKEKPKSGFDKIKSYLSKKSVPADGAGKKSVDYSDVPEGVG